MKRVVELVAMVALLVALMVAASGIVQSFPAAHGDQAGTRAVHTATAAPALAETKDQPLSQFEIDEAFGALRPDDGKPPQTKVAVHTQARGGNDEIYRSFAKAMTAENPTPADRAKDFAWVKDRQCRVTGWEATIVKAEAAPGGWYVMVSVRPGLAKVGGGARYTDGHRFETYHFASARIRYVGGVKPPQFGVPAVQTQPIN